MTLADTTCLIPLYRSQRLLTRVFENIDSHIELGASVLCSDEHMLDDAANQISARYAGNPLVRVLTSDQGGNWTSNCNRMIAACETEYFRIMPHDDTILGPSTAMLADALRLDPELVLSHGRVLAETEDGARLPERDEPLLPMPQIDDRLVFSAGLFWQGLYAGAFKAVMRRNAANGGPLLIRQTPSLRNSERAWLFGYSLLGGFSFTEQATMVKRYWKGSLTHGWAYTATDQIDVAQVMVTYIDDFVTDQAEREALRTNLFLNAVRRANWFDGLIAERPQFMPPFPLIGQC